MSHLHGFDAQKASWWFFPGQLPGDSPQGVCMFLSPWNWLWQSADTIYPYCMFLSLPHHHQHQHHHHGYPYHHSSSSFLIVGGGPGPHLKHGSQARFSTKVATFNRQPITIIGKLPEVLLLWFKHLILWIGNRNQMYELLQGEYWWVVSMFPALAYIFGTWEDDLNLTSTAAFPRLKSCKDSTSWEKHHPPVWLWMGGWATGGHDCWG